MGLVLWTTLALAAVKPLNEFQLVLVLVGVLNIFIMSLYFYGIFRVLRWTWRAAKRRRIAKSTHEASQVQLRRLNSELYATPGPGHITGGEASP